MDLTPELYFKVAQYISGELGRLELEDWVIPRLEELLGPESPGSHELVAELELNLAELSHGDITEEELRMSLSEFLNPFHEPSRAIFVRLAGETAYTTLGSEATIRHFPETVMAFTIWHAPTEPLSISQTELREVVFADR